MRVATGMRVALALTFVFVDASERGVRVVASTSMNGTRCNRLAVP
jgi:hypothetical protein